MNKLKIITQLFFSVAILLLIGRELYRDPLPVAGQLGNNDTIDELIYIGAASTSQDVVMLSTIKTDPSYVGTTSANNRFKLLDSGVHNFDILTAPITLSAQAVYGVGGTSITNSTSTYTPGIPLNGARQLGVYYNLVASSSSSRLMSTIEGSNNADCTDTTSYFGMPLSGGIPNLPIGGATGNAITLGSGVTLTLNDPAASSSQFQYDFTSPRLDKKVQIYYTDLIVRCVRFGLHAEGATTTVFIEAALQK